MTSSVPRISILLSIMTFAIYSVCPLFASAGGRNDSTLLLLEAEIALRPQYTAKKEAKIASIRKEYQLAPTPEAKYDAAMELFKEYRCFQADSAYRYATTLCHMAEEIGEDSKKASAYVALLDYYTSVGFFKEAAEIKDKINPAALPKASLPEYYSLCDRFLQNIQSYVGGRQSALGQVYEKKRVAYLDSLISVCNPNTAEYRMAVLTRDQIFKPSPVQVLETRQMILDRFDLSDHERAIQYSLLGHAAIELGRREEAKNYLALSAMYDIKSNTKETTAAKMLAEMLYDDGDINDAYKLIHIAFDDASFYNSRLRKEETSSVMRVIETEQHNAMNTRLWLILAGAALIFILLVSSLWFLSRMRKKKREVEETNNLLHSKSQLLDQSNSQLAEAIKSLQEVTQIKDRYIMETLYLNTSFVNKVEEKCQGVVKLLKDKKYEAIKFLPYEIGIKEERARIYRSFDKAFLSLFPSFPAEFNELFDEENRLIEDSATELPPEVRIFALMRIGISDTKDVADYLNLSPKTVYVYKAKVKARSKVDNNDFEDLIMQMAKD